MPAPTIDPTTMALSAARESLFAVAAMLAPLLEWIAMSDSNAGIAAAVAKHNLLRAESCIAGSANVLCQYN
jgi:hypothetical protein